MNVIFVLRHTWQVQDKSMANNVAYTSGKLSLHTDYPALHFAPGVSKMFLKCRLEDSTATGSAMNHVLAFGLHDFRALKGAFALHVCLGLL